MTRQLNLAGVALLKMSEACVPRAYEDPRPGQPIWTIGYGHTGRDVFEGMTWTQAQCEAILLSDLRPRCEAVDGMTHDVPTSDNQFAAMVDFAYNVGTNALKASHLLAFHRLGRFAEAAKDFANYNHSNGQVLAGLTIRRQREAELYATPPLPSGQPNWVDNNGNPVRPPRKIAPSGPPPSWLGRWFAGLAP